MQSQVFSCSGPIWRVLLICSAALVFTPRGSAQITVAQLSDTHLGDKHAPHAAENLELAVRMINERHPDAVVLSGDIGENPKAWEQAKQILKGLKFPLYYAPGNHDVHSSDVERYRGVFGKDYYSFRIKDITFVVIDSQLLGNYDVYDAKQQSPLPHRTEEESENMLHWLSRFQDEDEGRGTSRGPIIGIQHIPVFHDGGFPDPKPYWMVSDPYRSKELKILHQLGIRHMLVGHWHNGRVFEREGITWHVAPSTAWLPWGGELGFAVHTISRDGDVHTEFVGLPAATP